MAERNTAEELDDVYEIKYSTDAMTGGADKRMYLYYQLADSIKKADSVDIIVSFLMESGVKMLLGELDDALKRGAKIRILTGNYLGITQPSALYLIKHKLGDQVDLRFYNEKNRSFHPKSYMFHYKDYSELYIGSSNISRSALTSGIEWNYRFSNKTDPINYEKFYNTFVDLFENHSIVIDDEELKKYSKNWHRPAVSKDLDRYDLKDDKETSNQIPLFEPRGAQIEALCALENTRAEGARRALVQAATGVGKTYLAAFDSKNYERVLFVAHREEILKQAAESFKNVRDSDDYGFFNGDSKCTEKSVIFASVATLGRVEYLNENYFAPDYFTYVVIDEFHHAVNEQYQRIVDYFKPKFLLGLTATPERMDGKNIYEICDYNVPYEISLKEAINKGMLVPFHYYGIFDETDYSKLHIVRGRYDEKELKDALINKVNNFLIELGTGFAYMGREVRITVGEVEKFIDMLFYNTQRHCYVVVEIKTGKFDSSYAGQLGTYVVAINHQMKTENDNPTLGLLICKDMDKVEAQYALESTSQPLGISSYELSKLIPEEFKGSLPTIEEIEAELKD